MPKLSADTLWMCIACGAWNRLGPCPNCGNEVFELHSSFDVDAKRITCPRCGHALTLGNIYVSPGPELRCPKCGKLTPVFKSHLPGAASDCFIATATYGSPHVYEVETLRKYRDTCLRQHALGRILIWLYERISPSLARWVSDQPFARRFVRQIIMPPLLVIARRSRIDDNA